jgi:glycosyltransferase involved in cell wall biosynthesis
MRICLVGDFSTPDEARKVMAHHMLKELAKYNEVLSISIRDICKVRTWRELKSFNPDIIHYIPGASTFSFLITKIMKTYSNNAKTVMCSTLHGFHGFSHGFYCGVSSLSKNLIPLMKTDVILVQSKQPEIIFQNLKCNVKFFICSGVDIQRFTPASENKKKRLREKYGISREKFVVLHIGSVRKWRNVDILTEISNIPDIQVVIVGRNSTKFENDIALELEKSGCKIINEYIPKIEEIYALSDCYVFPTIDPMGSIDIPLSVLEAMSVNLPVISTKFGGLENIFEEKDGFLFTDTEMNFTKQIKKIRENAIEIKTRDLVIPYSWENIAIKLNQYYIELLR